MIRSDFNQKNPEKSKFRSWGEKQGFGNSLSKKAVGSFSKKTPSYFIPFHSLMAPTLFRASRFVTWRIDKRDYYPGRGDEFRIHVNCHALPYRFKCISIQKMNLDLCRKRYVSDWQSMSFEGFEVLWTRIHQRPYEGELKVIVYTIDWLDPLPEGKIDDTSFLPVV